MATLPHVLNVLHVVHVFLQSATVADTAGPKILHTRTMKAFLASLAMAISFWVPATFAVLMMASAIPMKNLQLAILGAIGLMISLLFRFLIRKIYKDENLHP